MTGIQSIVTGQMSRVDGNKADWVTPNVVPDPNPLPTITGWNILIRPVEVDTEIKVGESKSIILPTQFTEDVKFLTNVGRVVAMGPMCYTDPNTKPSDGKFFPHGRYGNPWCQVGDYVVWAKHQGTKIRVKGVAFVLLQDELVLMTVKDPADINPIMNALGR